MTDPLSDLLNAATRESGDYILTRDQFLKRLNDVFQAHAGNTTDAELFALNALRVSDRDLRKDREALRAQVAALTEARDRLRTTPANYR